MKISETWLREWVNPAIKADELALQLTMAGLEVDSIEKAAPTFTGVVVGEITSIEKHPDADKLRVCQVADGSQNTVQVVCGAPNARVGLKIPFAKIGAVLPGDFQIKQTRIRGVESFGMLCAEQELGLAEQSNGLWELPDDAPVGQDIRVYGNLDDLIIEVDLTPNRGDCLSIRGMAREVGVINQANVNIPVIEPVAATHDDKVKVNLNAEDACPNYVCRVIKDINLGVKTPKWMVDKLQSSDIRSIDPVVDVTNYVLLELGQPMHAFDLDTIKGSIQVRMANEGEKIKLLDNSEATLSGDMLVIADDSRAVAVAGIMGGSETAVSQVTKNILLESAFFNPVVIAGKARGLGKHTDSSHRFERGVDPQLQVLAVERATELLLSIAGGNPGPVEIRSLDAYMPSIPSVPLSKANLAKQLAIEIPDAEVEGIFARLGFEIQDVNEERWLFKAPSWRFDIAIEADLIEEVARIYGYNNLPTQTPVASLAVRVKQEADISESAFREKLLANGYQEAITYSFVDPKILQLIDPEQSVIELTNPIASDMGTMRTSLWPGLITAIRSNLNRQHNRVRFFEIGLRFYRKGQDVIQEKVISGVITGTQKTETWHGKSPAVDFYDIKADVESLLSLAGDPEQFTFIPGNHPALHPGQCAAIKYIDKTIGYIGKLNPLVKSKLDLSQDVYMFELVLSTISNRALPEFQSVSKFPSVTRDLAFIVDQSVPVGDLLTSVRDLAGSYLKELKVFDVYQGKGIENNRKSVALGLTFQHSSRTLAEQEIAELVNHVVAGLQKRFSASLRGEL